MKRRAFSLFVAATLVASNIPASNVYAAATDTSTLLTSFEEALSTGDVITVDGISQENAGELLKDSSAQIQKAETESMYKATDVVNVIVELEDNSLLQTYVDEGTSKDFESYFSTSRSQKLLDALAEKRAEIKAKFAEKFGDLDVICEYDTVMNGFAISTEYANLTEIKSTPGVKRAFVSAVYELDDSDISDAETNMTYSKDMIGATSEESLGYAGEGMVVAILDTGLDYEHEAFSTYFPENGSFSKNDIASVVDSYTLSAETFAGAELTVDDLYVNTKVVFGYDYADNDTLVIPAADSGQDHGTHVAGTIAGNCDNLTGVAKDAQLMIMKVFSDNGGGASDTNIIAALDDAVTLGADVINMSLGSSAGFTEAESEAIADIYGRVGEAGINLAVSAGNSYSSSYYSNYGDYPLASNPDNGIVGSPSTYATSLSVASIENTHLANCKYILAGDETTSVEVFYTDNATEGKTIDTLNGTFEFVDCGTGTVDEVAAVDVAGKIALIKRGGITFTEKTANAANAGAVAVVVYNNTTGTISMSIDDYMIPSVSVTQAAGVAMLALENKVITISSDMVSDAANSQAYQMSGFSSWGVTADLKLKPEVTAPGGNIYSSVLGGGYANMSGTSMASPHVAGAMAIVKGYVTEKYPELSAIDTENMVNTLLMSTATPVVDSYGEYYSPRKTGAGLINTTSAITTKAYLSVDENVRPKAELGYNEEGVYEFSFNVNNMSDSELSYTIDTTVLAEELAMLGSGDIVFTMTSSSLGQDAPVEYTGITDGVVTVPANGTATVSVKITLADEVKEFFDAYCVNGTFIDGFVELLALDEDNSDLTLPFMGFYGDWAAAPVFDSEISSETPAAMRDCTLYDANSGYYLGQNMFGDYGVETDKYVISPTADITNVDGTPYFSVASTLTGLLRSAEELTYVITNPKGKVIDEFSYSNICKSYYYSTGGFITRAEDFMYEAPTFDGINDFGRYMSQGMYTITASATVCGTNGTGVQTFTESVYLDLEAPETSDTLLMSQDGNDYLLVAVEDNHYVAAVQLTTADGEVALTSIKPISEDTIGSTTIITYNITGLADLLSANGFDSTAINVTVVDYGLNVSDTLVSIVPEYSISFTDRIVNVTEGTDAQLILNITSDNSFGYTPAVTFTSSNEKVAVIDETGTVTANKKGVTTITATLPDGTKTTCKVVVTADFKSFGDRLKDKIGNLFN